MKRTWDGGQDPSEGGKVNQRAGSYWLGLPGGLIIHHLPTPANHLRYGMASVNVLGQTQGVALHGA